LDRLGELAGARLHLVEQPHVLDRDHRLVGEGLQERDLSIGEQPRLNARDRNRPNGDAVAHYWDPYDTAVTPDHCHRAKRIVVVGVDIRDLHHASLEYRMSRRAPPTWRRRIRTSVELEHVCGEAMVRHEVEKVPVEPVDKAELGLAEPPR